MFNITEKAAKRITELTAKENKPYIRVAVIGGGCSGFKYEIDFDDTKSETDQMIEMHGIQLLIDDVSASYLTDSTLDFEDTIAMSEFKIVNPQAVTKCGCGNSFSI